VRLRDWFTISLRDIRRQPVRSALTVLALVISSSLFVTLMTLGLETRSAIVEQLAEDTTVNSIAVSSTRTAGSLGSNVQLADQAGGKLDDTTVAALRRLPGVRSATPVVNVWQFAEFSVGDHDRRFLARTSAVDPAGSSVFALAAGSRFSAGASAAQVILGHGYAQALGLASDPDALVGQTVRITTQNNYRGHGAAVSAPGASAAERKALVDGPTRLTAEIVGVTGPAGNDNLMFIPLGWAHLIATAQTVTPDGRTVTEDAITRDGYSSVLVQTASSTQVRPVTAAIEKLGFGATSKQAQIDQINQLSTVMWIVLGAIAVISMVSAALGIVNTMLMTVNEQRYAIGVWRACGATRSLISSLFLLQAAILGIIGGVVGTGVGMLVSGYVSGKIAHLLQDQGLSALTIGAASPASLVAAVALTTVLAVLAGLYPAHRAARHIEV
jgi:putative ABC transport system permease protein